MCACVCVFTYTARRSSKNSVLVDICSCCRAVAKPTTVTTKSGVCLFRRAGTTGGRCCERMCVSEFVRVCLCVIEYMCVCMFV